MLRNSEWIAITQNSRLAIVSRDPKGRENKKNREPSRYTPPHAKLVKHNNKKGLGPVWQLVTNKLKSKINVTDSFQCLCYTHWRSNLNNNVNNLSEFQQRFPDSSSKHNFWTGRTNDVRAPVLTSTVLISPSLLGNNFTIRPIRHWPRGKHSSTSNTRSPTSAFRWGLYHFCLSCNDGMYSLSHRFPKVIS